MKPHSAGNGDEAGLQDREPTFLHQVDREPGEEEIGQGVDAVLADIDAEHHAVGEQLADVVPARPAVLRLAVLGRIHVDQGAALLDVVELGLVDRRMVLRLVDRLDPDDPHDDAEPAHHVEHVAPAMLMRDPAHQRREDHGREILPRIEERRRGAALIAREPGRDDARIGRE